LRQKSTILLSLILILAVLLSGCSLGGKSTPAAPEATDTPTSAPVPTPTPVTPLAVLVIPTDLDQETSNLYQKTVYDLAQQAGYRFQVLNTLTPAEMDPGLKVAIVLPPDPGLKELAAAAPQAQFLAVNIPEAQPGGNVSVLAQNTRIDITAFLAGYMAALTTDDYRTGIIIPRDDQDGQNAYTAFTNGQQYYCGVCNPTTPPWESYPLVQDIPSDAKSSESGAYADILIRRRVFTMFVYPSLATADLIDYLGTAGILVIGTKTPDKQWSNWIVTIQPDIIQAIQSAWPDLAAGNGGKTVNSPLTLADVNSDLLTPGKQRLAQQVLDDLLSGKISTGVNP
jgi:hypothetical protein